MLLYNDKRKIRTRCYHRLDDLIVKTVRLNCNFKNRRKRMDTFAQLPAKELEAYFTEAASRLGLPPHVVEKDFWVCWTLKRVFTLDGISDTLLFKGGTSLSKVHGLIRRFSEDMDVSIHREKLGFSGDHDPLLAEHSNKNREKLKADLAQAACAFITGKIQPALQASIESALPATDGRTWKLEPDATDPDGQSLAFTYPSTGLTPAGNAYLRPAVKIEFGARSDHWPAETRPLKPYLCDVIPDAMEEPTVMVKTMEAARTFWEKATILHQMAHLTEERKFPERYSRHYTDLAAMILHGVGEEAAAKEDLLEAVVRHKIAFYRSTWAHYETAKRGTLRLVPAGKNMPDLKDDLASMKEMFFDEPPSFESVIDTLTAWETQFNQQ